MKEMGKVSKKCEYCLDTGFMLCNGKNEPCVWCERKTVRDKAFSHGMEFGKHEGYEKGFKAGYEKAFEDIQDGKQEIL